MSDDAFRHYRFETYCVDTQTRELRNGDGAVIPLTGKAFDTLVVLIANRHRVVGKEELLAAVWPGRIVEDNNLTQAIATARRALGADGGDHRYIVTVPGRGYRFVAEVRNGDDHAGIPEAPAAGSTTAVWMPRRHPIALGALLLALALFAIAAWGTREPPNIVTASPPGPQATLAVLPFRSLSSGPPDQLLELGLAETLIARLSRSTSLRVLSLGSVQGFTGAEVDPMRAGMALGADYLVEGSTQQLGDAIRVNARLLSLPDGRTVWAGTFDQAPDRVFTLQDVLAAGVSSSLSLHYAAGVRRSPCDGGDARAYRSYLRGRYLSNRPDAAVLPEAIAAFRDATDRDPGCLRAWTGTAFASRASVIAGDRDPRRMFPLAKAATANALAIDPQSPEAHTSRGLEQFWYDWDWAASEASLRHAIALDGNSVEAHYALAHLLNNIGRADEAAPHARQATLLDPMSPLVNTLAAGFIANAGHRDEARQRLEQVLELHPDFWIALLTRGGMALARGDHASAIADLRRASEQCGGCSQAQAVLGRAYALAGDRSSAERVLADMQQRDREGYLPATSMASVHAALGDTRAALDLLERAYAERDMRMSFLKVDRQWDTLREQPRFRALMQRMNLESGRG